MDAMGLSKIHHQPMGWKALFDGKVDDTDKKEAGFHAKLRQKL